MQAIKLFFFVHKQKKGVFQIFSIKNIAKMIVLAQVLALNPQFLSKRQFQNR